MSTQREISSGQLARVAGLVAEASRSDDLAVALAMLVEGLTELTGADRAILLLEDNGKLVACYADPGSRHLLGGEGSLDGSLEEECYRAGRPVLSGDLTRDRRFDKIGSGADERSLIAVPVHLEGPPVGLVRLTSADMGRFDGRALMAARLVVASMRKLLLQSLRAEREAMGFREKDFANAGVWALRERRKAQLRRDGMQGRAVTLVRYVIRGYLTADIVHHMAALVRDSDHVFQDDAGAFTLILTGTSVSEARLVALRVKEEIEMLAAFGGDPVEVDWKVTELNRDAGRRRIA